MTWFSRGRDLLPLGSRRRDAAPGAPDPSGWTCPVRRHAFEPESSRGRSSPLRAGITTSSPMRRWGVMEDKSVDGVGLGGLSRRGLKGRRLA